MDEQTKKDDGLYILERIGIDHAEFCIHKHNYYQLTKKQLTCDKCSRTNCKFHGLTTV